MPDQDYYLYVHLTLSSDQEDALPSSFDLADAFRDKLSEKLDVENCTIDEVHVHADPINPDIEPPFSTYEMLDIVAVYVEEIECDLEGAQLPKEARESLSNMGKVIGSLRDFVASEMDAETVGQINKRMAQLDEAPDEILHMLAHKLGLKDCKGMERQHFLQWIQEQLFGEEEEKKQPTPN